MFSFSEAMRAVNARNITFEDAIKEVSGKEKPMLVTESDNDSGTVVVMMPEDFALLQGILSYQLGTNESDAVKRLTKMMATRVSADPNADLSDLEKTIRERLHLLGTISSETELEQ